MNNVHNKIIIFYCIKDYYLVYILYTADNRD